MEAERALNVNQAAERLGVDPESVRRLIRLGKLPAAKIGHNWRLRPSDLDALFEARKRGGANAPPEPEPEPAADEVPGPNGPPDEDAEAVADEADADEADATAAIATDADYALDVAAARIDRTPVLQPYREALLRPQAEGAAHHQWVATADLADLISWAKAVAADADAEDTP